MWVIFLLSAFAFAVLALGVAWIGNKVVNAMKRDDYKTQKHINEDVQNEQEGGNT